MEYSWKAGEVHHNKNEFAQEEIVVNIEYLNTMMTFNSFENKKPKYDQKTFLHDLMVAIMW